MSEIAWLWAAGMAAFAAWLGYRAGFARATSCAALLFWRCGVRAVDSEAGTITFRDGSTHKEPQP